jgi:hypothetical protein
MFFTFTAGLVIVLGSKSWNERDPHDLGTVVAIEILNDLKEKRFLNSGNGVSHGPAADSSNSLRRKRGILSLLGLNNATYNGNGSYSSSAHVSEEERCENKLSGPNRLGEEHDFRGSD